MLGSDFDRFTSRHKHFAQYANDRIYYFFGTNMTSNVCCCIAASTAAGIFSISGNDVLYYISLAVMAIVWIQASLLSGFLRHWFFIFFSAAYFLLPHVFIDAAKSVTESAEMSSFNDFLAQLSRLVSVAPLKYLHSIGFESFTASLTVMSVSVFLVFLGIYIRPRAKHSDFYCRTRLSQIK